MTPPTKVKPQVIGQNFGPFTFPGLEVNEGNLVILLRESEIVFNDGDVDIDFRVGTHSLFVQGSDGYVGIGTDSPRWNLNLVKDAGNLVLAGDVYSGNANVRPLFLLAHAGGTEASPSATQSGFLLGDFFWQGYDGSALVGGAKIGAVATENFSGSARGTRLGFYTVDNTTTGLDERLRIDQDGGIYAYNLLAAAASTDVNINGSDELHSVTSSKRFKKNIQPLDRRFDSKLIYKLDVRSFIWRKNTGNPDMVDFGLVAEEAFEILPSLVNLDADDRPYSVRYSMLSVLLLAEIQKLNRRLLAIENN